MRNSAGWHADPIIGNNHHGAGPGHYLRADFQAGLNRLTAMGLSLDALVYHTHHADILALGERLRASFRPQQGARYLRCMAGALLSEPLRRAL